VGPEGVHDMIAWRRTPTKPCPVSDRTSLASISSCILLGRRLEPSPDCVRRVWNWSSRPRHLPSARCQMLLTCTRPALIPEPQR
jgi:hypothetical protein